MCGRSATAMPGGCAAFGPRELHRRCALRKLRIGQHVDIADLHQDGGVSDVGRPQIECDCPHESARDRAQPPRGPSSAARCRAANVRAASARNRRTAAASPRSDRRSEALRPVMRLGGVVVRIHVRATDNKERAPSNDAEREPRPKRECPGRLIRRRASPCANGGLEARLGELALACAVAALRLRAPCDRRSVRPACCATTR